MYARNQFTRINSFSRRQARSGSWASLIAAIICFAAFTLPAQTQTFEVLHSFIGKGGGDDPHGGVSLDKAGNVYGTTFYGGFFDAAPCAGHGCGIAFKLNSAGQQTVIYSFQGRGSGDAPTAGLVRDAQGNLYGDTFEGGDVNHCEPPSGCGTVFKINTAGHETVVHKFEGGEDGMYPESTLILDAAGNLYGTTNGGGTGGQGIVFKIDPTGAETVLHAFAGRLDGSVSGGLVEDAQGNLYGSTEFGGTAKLCGGSGCGIVYKISPSGQETILYNFSGGADGSEAGNSLVLDSEGNLYGTTGGGGDLSCDKPFGCGVIFEIDTTGAESVLYTFDDEIANGDDPVGGIVRDAAANFYGTTYFGGANGMGEVFKVDPSGNQTILHSFTGGADGAFPNTSLAMDAAGNLYGTTPAGGRPGCSGEGCGVVFKITP